MTPNEINAYMQTQPHVTTDFKKEWNAQRFFLCDKMFAMSGKDSVGEEILTLKIHPEDGAF